jgi:hypothetical protein
VEPRSLKGIAAEIVIRATMYVGLIVEIDLGNDDVIRIACPMQWYCR